MLNCATVLLATSLAVGANDSKQDAFTEVQAFLGTWEATDIKHEGETLRVPISWQLILDGRFIESRWMSINETGEVVARGLDIIGEDPRDHKIKFWEVDSEGGVTQLTLVTWEDGKSVWDIRAVEASGKKRSGQVKFAFIDENSYKWAIKYGDGEENNSVFKRVKHEKGLWPERQHEAPEALSDQLSDISWWTGDYTVDGTDAFTKKASAGISTCGWVLDGKFVQYDIASVDSDLKLTRYRAIMGIDPATGKTTGWEFESTGTVGKYTVSNEGQDIVGKALSPEAGLLEFKGKMKKVASGLEYEASGELDGESKTIYGSVLKRLK